MGSAASRNEAWADFDAVIEYCDGYVAAGIGVVTVHDGVKKDLAQGAGRYRQPVFPENLSCWKACRQWQRSAEEGHRLPDDREGVQVILFVVQDVAGDLRASKASQLEKSLRIVGKKSRAV